jgi:hypothetical protein
MRVLVACEESQTVTKAFRAIGHNAFSCDLLPASGGHPEWHLRADVRDVLARALPWDMLIGFPPCDHLAVSGARWFPEKVADGRQQAGIDLFLALAHADVPRVAIENPVGIMSTVWRKPDQIVQPWYYGDEATKTTCLWLRNLPPLFATKVVGRGVIQVVKSGKRLPEWYSNAPHKTRKIVRSRTFPGLAAAMAEQWG